MKTEKNEFRPARKLTTPNSSQGKITHEMVEAYVARGRYLQSLYVVDFFKRLGRLPKTALIRIARLAGTTFNRIRITAREIAAQDKGGVCRHRH